MENARYKDNWSFDWLSVENIIRLDRSVMTYKVRNKLSPECLWDKFQEGSSQSNYAARHCRDLQIPRLNTEHAKNSFQYSAIKVWNDIPVAIRELPTIRSVSYVVPRRAVPARFLLTVDGTARSDS